MGLHHEMEHWDRLLKVTEGLWQETRKYIVNVLGDINLIWQYEKYYES